MNGLIDLSVRKVKVKFSRKLSSIKRKKCFVTAKDKTFSSTHNLLAIRQLEDDDYVHSIKDFRANEIFYKN